MVAHSGANASLPAAPPPKKLDIAPAPRSNTVLVAGASPVRVEPGTMYPLRLKSFAPALPVDLVLHSDLRVLGVRNADAAGTIETTVLIPLDIPAGRHTLTVSGLGRDGTRRW